MNTSCQKQLPYSTTKITEQIIDLPNEIFPQILITEKEHLELKWEVGYWQGMHKKALSREEALKKIIKEQGGQIRDLKNRLFGKKSEKKSSGKKEGGAEPTEPKRPRGQQPGSKGHGRTTRAYLSHTDESIDFSDVPKCSKCGTAYIPDESRESEIIEVEVNPNFVFRKLKLY